jgi:hypothetical protein
MGVGSELQELGRFLDDCERRGEAVESLDLAEVTGVDDQQLRANLELTLSADDHADGTRLCDPRVGPDGTVRFALDSRACLPLRTDHDVRVEPVDAVLDAGGTVTVTLAATVPDESEQPADGSGEGSGAVDDAIGAEFDGSGPGELEESGPGELEESGPSELEESGPSELEESGPSELDDSVGADATARPETDSPTNDRGVPPFKDQELLADVYESCDTFAAMADELPMDVTGETVRRYMIQHDIHEPDTYQTGQASQPVALSDGIGLPEDVTVETLIETVKNSSTIYEVKQDIDIEREDALEMLQELNLLNLVVGRLGSEREREITREDVVDCLREASAVQ